MLSILGAALTAFLAAASILVHVYWKSYPDDNFIEESIETYIEHKTGLDLDLTPLSPEKKVEGEEVTEDQYQYVMDRIDKAVSEE